MADPSDRPADVESAAVHLARALDALGFPPDPEMARTPLQVAQLLSELRPGPLPTTTPLPTQGNDLVVMRDLPFSSICAHHLLPFFGTCTIAYRPAGRIAGLGWFPRLVDALSRQPQLQERLADQLAQAITDALAPHSVGVHLAARQLCVELRGPRRSASFEVTALRGADDPALAQALALAHTGSAR